MAFTGKYEVVSFVKNDEFKKSLAKLFSDEDFEAMAVAKTEILQDGDDFTWTRVSKTRTYTVKFTLNKECEIESVTGQKFKTTATKVGGKVIIQFPIVLFTSEISGDKLIEHLTTSGVDGLSIKRISKRV